MSVECSLLPARKITGLALHDGVDGHKVLQAQRILGVLFRGVYVSPQIIFLVSRGARRM